MRKSLKTEILNIDTDKWEVDIGTGDDNGETPSLFGWGNWEWQYYTPLASGNIYIE